MTPPNRRSRRLATEADLPDFVVLPDLASRAMGSGVVAANDELFAEKENLIKPEEPTYSTYTFGHKGQVYDGWETRRRREPGFDWAIVRLGAPGVVRGIIVDTAYFKGNYPPEVSVQGAVIDGYPSVAELEGTEWFDLVPRSAVKGDDLNSFDVDCGRLVTHVRLCMHPDGGIARLRVHGEVVADPQFVGRVNVNLAALDCGAGISGCSNMFYSSPTNLIMPGNARLMGEGWETSRRRDDGNDWVEVRLAGPGTVGVVELDTRYFLGNAPGWARVTGWSSDRSQEVEILPKTRLQPDTRHRFRVDSTEEIAFARLDVYPDGGMARLRLLGELSEAGRQAIHQRWTSAGGPAR